MQLSAKLSEKTLRGLSLCPCPRTSQAHYLRGHSASLHHIGIRGPTVSCGPELREREIAHVHSASLAYEDGSVFMSMAMGPDGTKVIKSITRTTQRQQCDSMTITLRIKEDFWPCKPSWSAPCKTSHPLWSGTHKQLMLHIMQASKIQQASMTSGCSH